MASNRIGRINEEIQRELSELIRALKDPRVQTMLSITRVETTTDLRYAKVYVSVLEEARARSAASAALYAGAGVRAGRFAQIRRAYVRPSEPSERAGAA